MGQYITRWASILPGGSVYYQVGRYITRWVGILPGGSVYYQVGRYITRWVGILPGGSIYYQVGRYITRWVGILPDGSVCYQVGRYITRWAGILPGGSVYYQVGQYITRWLDMLLNWSIYPFIWVGIFLIYSNLFLIIFCNFKNFQIKDKYCQIPRRAIECFIQICPTCNVNKKKVTIPSITPIISFGFLQRLQVIMAY